MKKTNMILTFNFLFILGLSNSFAGTKSIYGEQGLQKVLTNRNPQIDELSNGVCAVLNSNGKGCCTGFFIAKDIVMTNYHCLSCAHKIADDDTSVEGTTDDFEIINSDPDFFSKIKIQLKTEENATGFVEEEVKITKLLAGQKNLDFLILKVEAPKNKAVSVNVLSDTPLSLFQKLATVGYPASSPFPGEKVFDETQECKVSKTNIERTGARYDSSFGHQCDTNPGSSGSPIFDHYTGKVVGLHWGGGAKKISSSEGDDGQENSLHKSTQNKGIMMTSIIEHLKQWRPEIYEELNIQ
jgi:V8-like Glu-specific endopeptidase